MPCGRHSSASASPSSSATSASAAPVSSADASRRRPCCSRPPSWTPSSRSAEWGIKASGEPDWSQIQAFENKVVDKLVAGLTSVVKARKVDVIRGSATLKPGPAVEVDGRTLTATDVVVATGSSPRLLPGIERSERVITSDEALWYSSIPSSAVIIGAGAIGLEFASFYRSMGADVTVVEALPRIAPLEDEDRLEGGRARVPQARHRGARRRLRQGA